MGSEVKARFVLRSIYQHPNTSKGAASFRCIMWNEVENLKHAREESNLLGWRYTFLYLFSSRLSSKHNYLKAVQVDDVISAPGVDPEYGSSDRKGISSWQKNRIFNMKAESYQRRWPAGRYQCNLGFLYNSAVAQANRLHAKWLWCIDSSKRRI